MTDHLDEKKIGIEPEVAQVSVQTSEQIEAFAYDSNLHRGLKQRHIQMIALAGAIGTGLFLSSGGALHKAGPVGLLLAYLIVGVIVSSTQLAICEVSTFMPVTGAYIRHSAHFVDPALGFAIGWNKVYQSLVSGPSEIVAAAVLFRYWTDINSALWISIALILLVASNVGPVQWYGDVEVFFAVLKIILILGLILVGLIIDLGGTSIPRLGFQYWRNPGPFAEFIETGNLGKFIGFWAVLSSAVYAYGGVNEVSIAAGETQNPRFNIPRASKRIFIRIAIFYLLLLFIITLVLPYNDPKLSNPTGDSRSSPMVIAIERAGIKVLPHIINAVVISSAWSAGNSGMLGGTRILYALAAKGQAPKIFLKTTSWGLPWVALIVKTLFLLLAYMATDTTASKVFGWFQSLTSSTLLLDWITMNINQIWMDKALKAQGYSRDALPWSAKITPYASRFGLVACIILLLTGGFTVFIHGHWSTATFFSSYFSIPFFIVSYIVGRFWLKSKFVDPAEVDLQGLFADAEANPAVETSLKGWRRLEAIFI